MILPRAFDWFITPEGIEFWREINKENYSVFYEKYPQDELHMQQPYSR
jgi:hypothetical protein